MRRGLVLFLLSLASMNSIAQGNCFPDCWANSEKARSASLKPSPESGNRILQGLVGCKAPNFRVKTMTGDSLTLSELSGKVVVLNFWFIGCAPCQAELPALNALAIEYQKKD